MNYLSLQFQSQCHLRLMSDSQQLIAEEILELTPDNWWQQLDILVAKIDKLAWQFSGIVCDLNEDSLTDGEKTARQSLAEKLNCPLVTTTELEKADKLETFFTQASEKQSWSLDYYGYTPGKSEYSVESLLTTGNGFLGLRGTLPEMEISEAHYPATYLAGLYNAAESKVEGRKVINEDFVNAPNLQYFSVKINGEVPIEITPETVTSLHRHLDLRTGLFSAEAYITSGQYQLKIKTKRVVNMAAKEHYSLQYEVTPLNFSGPLAIVTKSDTDVINFNTERYRSLTSHHLETTALQADKVTTTIAVKTRQSQISVIQHSELFGELLEHGVETDISETAVTQTISLNVKEGRTYTLAKGVTVKMVGPKEEKTVTDYLAAPLAAKNFQTNLAESKKAWAKLWQQADIALTGDLMSQKLIRLHTYHLLVSGSPIANQELDVSITARGLHGEAYRGHIFWDEIFILPFYQLHFPEMAKQLLMYRYNRLPAAKANAKEAGYTGAMYPWQSGLDGSEQTQEVHLNPLNGEWGEDYSRLQRHVSLAIAYNIWHYWHATKDDQFLATYGGEMLLEIAEFWRSKTSWDEKLQRYSIKHVMGPDEFHETYPDREQGGIDDNAYTNLMVVWLFEEIEALSTRLSTSELTNLQTKTNVSPEKMTEMKKIRQHLYLEINPEGIMAQYAGYFDLKEVDWTYYQEKYGNIYRMDRILKADGKSADDYQVAKQADTLMIFYNFSQEKVSEILNDLGYDLPADYVTKNFDYYLPRTSHGSTLSRIVHAHLAEMVGKEDLSWQLYQEALRSDYQDIQGGTTAEGIHTGVMAATLMVTLQTYGGVDTRGKQLSFTPDLPKQWQDLRFNLTHQGIDYHVDLNQSSLTITASQDSEILVGETRYALSEKQPRKLNYLKEHN